MSWLPSSQRRPRASPPCLPEGSRSLSFVEEYLPAADWYDVAVGRPSAPLLDEISRCDETIRQRLHQGRRARPRCSWWLASWTLVTSRQ